MMDILNNAEWMPGVLDPPGVVCLAGILTPFVRSSGIRRMLRSGRYTHGRYWLRSDWPRAGDVEAFIREERFLHEEAFQTVATRMRRHRMFEIDAAELGLACMMKKTWPDPSYPPLRRLNIAATQLLKRPGRRSMIGALALESAGVPTVRAIACWRHRYSAWEIGDYFLYEKAPAAATARDYRLNAMTLPAAEHRRVFAQIVEVLAGTLRGLHDAGLRHDDTASGNFLVANPDGDGDLSVIVIDTDNVHYTYLRHGTIKRFMDIGDLRRLEFKDDTRRRFLEVYLGARPNGVWTAVDRFWQWRCGWTLHAVSRRLRGREI